MISEGIFAYWERNEYRKVKNSAKSKIHGQQVNNNNNNKTISNNVNENNQLNKPLKIDQLQSVFYSFAIGVIISNLSFIIEILLFYQKLK